MSQQTAQNLTPFLLLGVTIYCCCQVARDRRQEQYGWAAFAAVLGLASFLLVLTTPIETHAVKIELPRP